MTDEKQNSVNRDTKRLKCDLPPKEALKRAMLVPIPDYRTTKHKSRNKTSKR